MSEIMSASIQGNRALMSQKFDDAGKIMETSLTAPIAIEYKTPQESLQAALNFNEDSQSVSDAVIIDNNISSPYRQTTIANVNNSSATAPLLRNKRNASTNNYATSAAFAAGLSNDNSHIALDSTSKMKQFVNTMVQKMNNTKYLYPAMAVLITAILVIIVLFQKISIIVKIICVALLIVLIALTVIQFKQI